jgi:hypothetical protein
MPKIKKTFTEFKEFEPWWHRGRESRLSALAEYG